MSLFERADDYHALPDCCYRCESCGLKVCMDTDPSPAEPGQVCADCYAIHGPEGDCYCCEDQRLIAAQLEALQASGPTPYDPASDPSIDRTDKKCIACRGTGEVIKHRDYRNGTTSMGRCLICRGTGEAK